MKKLLLLPYTRTGGVIALTLLFSALFLAAAVSFKDPTAGQLVGFHDPNTFTNMTVSGGSTQVVALAVGSLTVTNQILVFPDDLKIAGIGAFNTNFIDAAAGALQVFTNSLSTNQVFIVTNGTVGLKVELFVYGAMFHGGIQTNAWQIVCAAPASPGGFRYFWPPGSTNGNYECLVNSNQVVKFFFEFPRSTNCMASYRVYE